MLKQTNYYFAFLFIIFITGCKKQKNEIAIEKSFTKFPQTLLLKGKKTNTEAHFKSAKVKVFDSLLVLTNTDSKEKIHIYKKNNYEYLTSAGKVGKGAGELTRPFWNSWDEEGRVIWYPDMGKGSGKIIKFEIDSILRGSNYNPIKSFIIPSNIRFTKIVAPYSGDLFSYSTDNPEFFFYVADKKGNIINSLNLPNKANIYPNLDRRKIMGTQWYYYIFHPTKKKVLIAYHYADIILITDLKGNIIKKIQGPDNIKEKPKLLNAKEAVKNERKTTYWCLRADRKYIYCLYSGRNFFVMKGDTPIPQYAKSILIFTWEGKPVMRLNLDHSSTSFDLDKENNRIITFATDIGELIYYNFDFNKLK